MANNGINMLIENSLTNGDVVSLSPLGGYYAFRLMNVVGDDVRSIDLTDKPGVQLLSDDATVVIGQQIYEVPMQYIGKRIKLRYLPSQPDEAYIFSDDHKLLETIHLVNKVDNAKIKRKKRMDFSDISEE